MNARLLDSSPTLAGSTGLPVDVCVRALEARDARFDGVFFVGIVSTGIYCRPICPARVSRPEHRRFFRSAAEAERNGFRPCRRCRPELAPGRALVDAVPRLAHEASRRIAGGALNGRSVGDLARELCVSERHLRRALRAELGVSPLELARTHRLLLAKQLLTDTTLPLTRIAFASGFQSVRSFQAAFRKHYRMAPRELRRAATTAGPAVVVSGRGPGGLSAAGEPRVPAAVRVSRRDSRIPAAAGAPRNPSATGDLRNPAATGEMQVPAAAGLRSRAGSASASRNGRSNGGAFATDGPDALSLRLAYRPPLDWPSLLDVLRAGALPGVEIVDARRYTRLVAIDGHVGQLTVEPARGDGLRATVTTSLLPVLMPLIQRIRRAFDLDANPAEVDAHLREGGLGALVDRRPGLRLPGAWDGFEAVFRSVIESVDPPRGPVAARLIEELGEPVVTGVPGLFRLVPEAGRVAKAGVDALAALGLPTEAAATLVALARRCADGTLPLHPGADGGAAYDALLDVDGVEPRLAARIATRATGWPDLFPADEPALLRAAGARDPQELLERSAAWRPWRGYAALHLLLADAHRAPASPTQRS